MRKFFFFLLAGLATVFSTHAQSNMDYSVMVKAEVKEQPAAITLSWPAKPGTSNLTVWRKAKDASSWGTSAMATLNASDTTYTDNTVEAGKVYEYRITAVASTYTAYGYILSGIKVPATEQRGRMILLVDKENAALLTTEIERLMWDLRGDGWVVIKDEVDRNASPASIRSLIGNHYSDEPQNTKAVFLLGSIPVPYSGNFAWDGHPDHEGAWPADTYYGDLDGTFEDFSVETDTTANIRRANWNLPGDGRFDNIFVPSTLEVQVGRVDLRNMPAFQLSEDKLLQRYLDKDHAWRMKMKTAEERAIVENNFGNSPEAFSASAYKSFAPMFGAKNIETGDYFASVTTKSYLWSYGAGGGSDNSSGGIANTQDFADADNVQTAFTMLFGSYFGDWNTKDNFLRAPLAAKGMCLGSAWSGRPHWVFHSMALGETLGYCAYQSQNPVATYFKWSALSDPKAAPMSANLMGDPSLRMHMVAPATGLNVSVKGNEVKLGWTASTDNVEGYNIYRTNDITKKFEKLNTALVTAASYTDVNPGEGKYYYMVRAMKLQQSASGTYYNLSTGTVNESGATVGIAPEQAAEAAFRLFPNPSAGEASLLWEGASCRAQLTVTDLAGREVITAGRQQLNNGSLLQLDMQGQPAGIYMVKLNTEAGTYAQKLIVR